MRALKRPGSGRGHGALALQSTGGKVVEKVKKSKLPVPGI